MTKVALFGYGYWGPGLARNLATLPGNLLYGVADVREERLALVKRLHPGALVTQDYRLFLEDPAVDGVVLATPPGTHGCLAKEALLHDKHVLVEKPLAMTSAEAEELIELADTRGPVLMVGHTFLYSPSVRKLRDLIISGELGELLYLHSQRLNLGRVRQDVDVLWNLGPHDVSILLYLLGKMPERVSAIGYTYLQPDVADVAFVDLQFPDRIGAHVHLSWLDPGKVRRLTVVGREKMIVYDDTNPDMRIAVYDKGIPPVNLAFEAPSFETYHEFQLTLRSGDVYIPKVDATEPLRIECAHFIACIEGRDTCLSDGRLGLRVLQVLEAASHSMEQNGNRIEVSNRLRQ